MSATELDPQVAAGYRNELLAVEEGHGPVNDEVREQLGRFSMVGGELQDAKAKIEQSKANLAFLREVASLLPHPHDKGFEIDSYSPDAQYKARQIQANTLWLYDGPSKVTDPYFIIGRRNDPSDPESTDLLLLAPNKPRYNSLEIMEVVVRKDDMRVRDELAERASITELPEGSVHRLIDKDTGNLIINSDTSGSIRLTDGMYYGKATEDRITKNGVRKLHPDGWVERTYGLREQVPQELMDSMDTDNIIAKLMSALKLSDKYKKLLDSHASESEDKAESTLGTPTLSEAASHLSSQNQELKKLIRQLMLDSKDMPTDQVEEYIKSRFPQIDLPDK